MTPSPDPIDFAAEDAGYVRNAAVMTAGTALSRVTGFLRLSAQVAAIGVTGSALADTYTTANTTPNILYELALGGILTSVFVPLFVDWMQQHGRVASWEVADRVLTLTLVVLGAIAVLGIVFAPQIIGLYNSLSEAPDQAAQLALGTYFLRWFMPQIVFYGVGAVAGGLLNANRRFAAPMFTPVLNNLVVIATFGVYAWILHGGSPTSVADVTGAQTLVLAAGTTLGVVAMTVALWPSLRAVGYRWHLRFDWNHPALRRLARLAGWVVVYVAANQLAYLVIIVLNRQVQGGITAYAAAFIVFSLPHAIFAVSIFTALLPAMSAAWSDRNVDDVRMLFSRGIRDTAVVIVPAAFGFIAIALPITRLLFQHGESHANDATLIADTLRAFAVGLPFFSMFQLLTRTFYSMQDTRTPALVNVGAAVVNVVADLVYFFVLDLGIPGLALGHATSYVAGTVALLVIARGRLGGLDGARIGTTIAKVVPLAALAGLAAWAMTLPFPGTGARLGTWLLEVALAVSAGLLVFLAGALIVRLPEVDDVKNAVRRRFRG
ncbi:MAG: murein biosynthesis integral membrane protein MurJ [Actinomycetota bacterium]